jgi:hypothetical protein
VKSFKSRENVHFNMRCDYGTWPITFTMKRVLLPRLPTTRPAPAPPRWRPRLAWGCLALALFVLFGWWNLDGGDFFWWLLIGRCGVSAYLLYGFERFILQSNQRD